MRVIDDISRHPVGVDSTAVTIGAYDGVHLGHRAVIAEVRRARGRAGPATARSSPSTATRPRSCGPSRRPGCSPTSTRSSSCSAATGVDLDARRSTSTRSGPTESAEDFVAGGARRLPRRPARGGGRGLPLRPPAPGQRRAARGDGRGARLRRSRATHLVGPDGAPAARRGHGVVHRHPPRAASRATSPPPTPCSAGPTRCAAPWSHGDDRGRELGFPTANVADRPARSCCPADGIYAGWFERADGAVAAVGDLARPPADVLRDDADASLLEVHLLDFDGDLYGERGARSASSSASAAR